MAVRKNLGPTTLLGISGPLAAARFTPGASTAAIVTHEKWGIDTITRDSEGVYTLKIAGRIKGLVAFAAGQDNGTTLYHVVRVESQSDAASTVTVSHKSVAFADVATGPAVSDTIDAITVLIYGRVD